jgi:hypothetical protein
MMRAGRDGATHGRVQAAAFGDDELDRVEEALVLRDVRRHQGRELRDDVAARVAEGRVGLDLGPVVGAGEVDRDVGSLDRDLAVDVDVLVALRVVVDVGVRLVDAVRPARDLRLEAPLRVLDDVVGRGADGLGAIAATDLLEAARADLGGADLRAEVAEKGRRAVVRREHVRDVLPLDAPLEHLDRGEAHALGPDVGRVDVVAARRAAAGIRVVTLDRSDQHHLAVVKDGRVDVVVGQVSATVVGIVAEEDVTLEEAVPPEELEREADRQGAREHELRDPHGQRGEAAARVEDGRVPLVRLVQDRGRRGQRDVGRHLEGDRLHRSPDDPRGDRVDAGRRTSAARGRGRSRDGAGASRLGLASSGRSL